MRTIEITLTERIGYEPTKNVRFKIRLEEIDSLPTLQKGVVLEKILMSMKEKMEEKEPNGSIDFEIQKPLEEKYPFIPTGTRVMLDNDPSMIGEVTGQNNVRTKTHVNWSRFGKANATVDTKRLSRI